MLGFMYRHMDEELKPFVDIDFWLVEKQFDFSEATDVR